MRHCRQGVSAIQPRSPANQPELQRRHRGRRRACAIASFLSSLLSLILAVQTCALPIPVAFLFISADAAAVTEGCDTKTCCTTLCYVDEHGVHHCVHKHNDSCARGDANDESSINPVLLMTMATVPEADSLMPSLDLEGLITARPDLRTARYPANPKPPPK